MIKFANPLAYPTAMLLGGGTLLLGVWGAKIPTLTMLLPAAAVSLVAASAIRSLNPTELEQNLAALETLKTLIRSESRRVQTIAGQLLPRSDQFDLQTQIVQACTWADSLPEIITDRIQQILKQPPSDSIALLSAQIEQYKRSQAQNPIALRMQLIQNLEATYAQAIAGRDSQQQQIIHQITFLNQVLQALQDLGSRLSEFASHPDQAQLIQTSTNQIFTIQSVYDPILEH